MKRRHHGFTLIELAIVITVIGLLLGGVFLAGSSVLERSRFASLLTKIKDLGAAANVFKTKYGYSPGDLPNAGTYITENGGISLGCTYAPAATPAPGDGLVNTTTESTCALEHLVKAGLLAKAERDAVTGYYFISSDFGVSGRVSLWFNSVTNENAILITNLPCSTALEIDRKLDADSLTPLTIGNVVGRDASNAPFSSGTCTPETSNDPVPKLLVKY